MKRFLTLAGSCLCIAALAVPAQAGVRLGMNEARSAARTQLKLSQWDNLLEGHTHIGRCHRVNGTKAICPARTTLHGGRCTFTVNVRERGTAYSIAVRHLRCR